MKKIALVFLSLFTICLLGACGNKQKTASKQVLTWTETSTLATQDQSLATDSLSFQTLLNTQEGLYRLDKQQKPKLALAKSVKISNDGKTYDFILRPNAKWSNGDPVTAKDFVYAYKRTVTPSTKASMAFYFYQIENAEAINKGQKDVSELGVKALAKDHLQIKLTRPVSYFKRLLAFPLFFPQNEKIVKKYGDLYGTQAKYTVANGPYILKNWTGTNKKWSLVKNKTYWDAKNVKLDQVNELVTESTTTSYNLYNSNKVDATGLLGQQVAANKNSPAYHERLASAIQRLELNEEKVPAFKNKNIRQAFSYAIDRKSLVNDVLADGSVAAKGFVPSGMGSNPQTGQAFQDEAYVKSAVSYDLKKANALLEKGYQETGITTLNVELSVSDTDSAKKIAEFLQSSLERLPNVKVTITSIPYTQLITRQAAKDYELTVKNWQAIIADPINFLDVFESDSSYNNSGWKNAEYDRLLDEAENKYGAQPEKRWQLLVKAEKLLMEDQGTIPLLQVAKPQLLRPSVKGVYFNPTGIPYDFKTVSLAEK
ncbi:peptide ABC transporter substrate-binding protein [Ligilactobacillus murinus]|uniref:Peptide ABC transporter substrate-binding protein n=1 Tax=Ligilactobacillus murinus TaxID=1622 RepID=A0AAE6WEC0_9LACO|nr:peptide ABC transporter substrate-binding protein [Ligilactobacillus murinus]NEF83174.1 peptide ABC transporter substrate-binding protein [Ligilactobacillus murinus]NEF85325.1 peptide ABC transporter substrate-binding protein [Ligilactobacillus murinus]NEF87732.1 peptide ABC transporter substrate-binding protein [Ligilactobacillus murinus]NEF90023.1 peptide ABC transporter substrate-binding protein [Ligilactobacillus murinus]NEF92294.1 peptide ABC transporter substrate-binding protein [Ligi